jgi:transforming growth factor-beta-induced protein
MNRKLAIVAVAAVAAALVIGVALSGVNLNLRSQVAPTKTVVENMQENGNFTTLTESMNSTGLTEALNATGPFTVFAPTDDAFGEMNSMAEHRLMDDRENLTKVLQYHVVPGDLTNESLTNGMTLTTLAGVNLTVIVNETGTYINDAKLGQEIDSTNGVVHAVDKVLVPRNIVQTVDNDTNLTMLAEALNRTNLTEALNATGPFTVFAPTNAAFSNANETVRGLMEKNDTASTEQLRQLLLYHVVPAKVVNGNGTENQTMDTLSGQRLVYRTNDSGVFINNNEVVKSNIIATNGVVYTIDSVLATPQTINMTLASNASLSRAYEVLSSANLTDTLNASGPFTVFVPNNEAFAMMGNVPTDEANLTAILTYHVLNGEMFSWQLENGTVTTLNGQPLNVTVNHMENGTVWTVGNATIVTSDIICTNGVIHVIDKVLVPPDMTQPKQGAMPRM